MSVHRTIAAAALAAALALGGTAAASADDSQSDVPPRVRVGEGHKPFLLAHAVGVQIYTCTATPDGGAKWAFVAPRADLYADNGQLVATHFAGPTWQARDGSQVKAQRVDGVTVDETAIPWLLLKTHSPLTGPDGDRLTATTYIQRLATTGGVEPPAAECTAATVGQPREVPYTADYRFWKKQGDPA
jgi:hypothetical protein